MSSVCNNEQNDRVGSTTAAMGVGSTSTTADDSQAKIVKIYATPAEAPDDSQAMLNSPASTADTSMKLSQDSPQTQENLGAETQALAWPGSSTKDESMDADGHSQDSPLGSPSAWDTIFAAETKPPPAPKDTAEPPPAPIRKFFTKSLPEFQPKSLPPFPNLVEEKCFAGEEDSDSSAGVASESAPKKKRCELRDSTKED